jgi:hypothetical protein
MIRELKIRQISFDDTPVYYKELAGLHDDTKPTASLATGSIYLEVDTGDVYAYDEDGVQWSKIASLGGDA